MAERSCGAETSYGFKTELSFFRAKKVKQPKRCGSRQSCKSRRVPRGFESSDASRGLHYRKRVRPVVCCTCVNREEGEYGDAAPLQFDCLQRFNLLKKRNITLLLIEIHTLTSLICSRVVLVYLVLRLQDVSGCCLHSEPSNSVHLK